MSRSFDCEKSWPQNCTKLGKHIDAEHAVAVHVVDALVDVAAALADLVVARWARCCTPRAACPATALSPMLGISLPSYSQTSVPSSLWTNFGANSFHFVGKVVVEERGRLDDVVVDADQDEVLGVRHGLQGS